MTTGEGLRSATVIGARAAGQEDEAGAVEVGKLANLLVLRKKPLENIGNIRSVFMVVKRGVRFPRSEYKPGDRKGDEAVLRVSADWEESRRERFLWAGFALLERSET